MDNTQAQPNQEKSLLAQMIEGPNKEIDRMITPYADDVSKAIVGARECFRLVLYGIRCARDEYKRIYHDFKRDHWNNPDMSILNEGHKQ